MFTVGRVMQTATCQCPSAARPPSTRRPWPWAKRGADTPGRPRLLSEPRWTSSRLAGWSQAARLRNTPDSSCAAAAQHLNRISGNYGSCNSPLNTLIGWKKYGNESQTCPSEEPLERRFYLFAEEALSFHCLHTVSPARFSLFLRWLRAKGAKSCAYLQPWALRWRRRHRARGVLRTGTSPNVPGWS